MRVLYLSPAGNLGGAERVLLDVLHGVRSRADAGVLAFAAGPLIREIERLGVPVWVVPLPSSVAELGEQSGSYASLLLRLSRELGAAAPGLAFLRESRRVVDAFAPDLVHSNGLKAHLLARLLCGRRPLFLHVHDFYARRALSRHLLGRLVRPPVTLIAISNAAADDARRVFPRAPIEVVYNAIDTDEFAPGPSEPEWLDALAGLPPMGGDVLRVGLVATYAHWKGHDVFLRAARLLAEWGEIERFRFYVVGAPIYATAGSQFSRAELGDIVDRAGLRERVGFVDFQRDIARVYRSLSVIVHASTAPEPFGRTIIEGMASGKPVLSTATGGAAELFEPGASGLRVVPGSAGSLAAALLQVASEPALVAQLSHNARAAAVLRFDRRRLGPAVLGAYARALGNGG